MSRKLYDKLVIKVNVNVIDTKIPSTSGLVTKKSIIHKSMVLRRNMKMLENHNKKVKDDLKKDSKCY